MVFQDPMTSLNPTMKIGKQITEVIIKASRYVNRKKRRKEAMEILKVLVSPMLKKGIK